MVVIYTVTLNPSIDYYVGVDGSVYDNEVNRASKEKLVAAGKGINISKTLHNLNVESTAVILVGGFTGKYISDQLEDYSCIKVKKIDVEGNTRINVKVKDSKSNFAINGIGPCATDKCEEEILKCLSNVEKDDYIIISGSMMPGIKFDTLIKISELVHDNQARLVVDMSSLHVEKLKELKPNLIKPNLEELYYITQEKDVDKAIGILQNSGIENILLSKGKDGFSYYTEDDHYEVMVSEVDAINNVGCGDNLLAGFIASVASGNDVKEALKFAGACASASVCTYEQISLEDIVKYVQGIKVRYMYKMR